MAQQTGESPQCVVTPTASTRINHFGKELATRSFYKPLNESMKAFKGETKILGALQIMSGALIFAVGVFLGLFQYTFKFPRSSFFMTIYIGYPFWGAALFIISGSISIAAEMKPMRNLVQSSFGINISSAAVSAIGIIFLFINFVLNRQNGGYSDCWLQVPNVCSLVSFTSNGLLSLMLILTVLELCITITITVLGCKANCCESNEVVSSSPDSVVVVGMPPAKENSEGLDVSILVHETEISNK